MQVGDRVFIVDANRGTLEATVQKVGRKYFTAGGYDFDIDTGYWRNKDFGSTRIAYTEAEYERRQAYFALKVTLNELVEAVGKSAIRDRLPAADGKRIKDTLDELSKHINSAVSE
jgi:hypothetical protein